MSDDAWFTCPGPEPVDGRISLAHGEGGRLSRLLVQNHILRAFRGSLVGELEDAAQLPGGGLTFTTDGFTVTPLFFPGGDLGQLAVYGTVNDLAVAGAVPHWISVALIIEEGLPLTLLDRILEQIQAAANVARVEVVTGDTKVVPRGAADQIYVVTSGLGIRPAGVAPGARNLQRGDRLIVTGPIGRHGAAILCCRENLGFSPAPTSDCACLAEPLLALQQADLLPHAMRDATRGGVAAVLQEWTESTALCARVLESHLPVSAPVRAVCELLGLEAIHLANEGTCVLATPPDRVDATLQVLRGYSTTAAACVIGHLESSGETGVLIRRTTGQDVILESPSGAPLPRIC